MEAILAEVLAHEENALVPYQYKPFIEGERSLTLTDTENTISPKNVSENFIIMFAMLTLMIRLNF
jgi:hypothetical protein